MKTSNERYINPELMGRIKQLVDDGYISAREHPNIKGLFIYNYTRKTQFEQKWTEETKMCRGLVIDKNNRIVIQCPKKFFNQEEPQAPNVNEWSADQILRTEKLDGYYISFRNDSEYGLIVTSRGSFENQYVDAAKKLLPEIQYIYRDEDYFCELCQNFPGDEDIIVANHETPRLVLWGISDHCPEKNVNWHMETAKLFSPAGATEHLAKEVEGIVLYNLETKERAKVKTEWYLMVHRLISGVTKKAAIKACLDGNLMSNNVNLPEEYTELVRSWEQEFFNLKTSLITHASAVYSEWATKTDKEIALECQEATEIKSLVFSMRKGQDYSKAAGMFAKNKLLRNSAD